MSATADFEFKQPRNVYRAWLITALLHIIVFLSLLLFHNNWGAWEPERSASSKHLYVELVPPPELETARPLLANFTSTGNHSQAGRSRPEQKRQMPPPLDIGEIVPPRFAPPLARALPTPRTAALSDRERQQLELDRKEALAEVARLEREGNSAANRTIAQAREEMRADQERRPTPNASDTAPRQDSSGGTSLRTAEVPVGTIRELDLSGYPQAGVDAVMQRYGLRITERALAGGVSQSFLSSASTGDGGRFSADPAGAASAPGVYQVFLLSPRAVAAMSRLEEAELDKRGLDHERTRVIRVKFGLVGPQSNPDLGVTLFEAEPVR